LCGSGLAKPLTVKALGHGALAASVFERKKSLEVVEAQWFPPEKKSRMTFSAFFLRTTRKKLYFFSCSPSTLYATKS